jgi:hypothetical protein
MHFLTHRRRFIKTMALASASVPIGLRHAVGAPAAQLPAWQLQSPGFGVQFSQAFGKLSAWRKGRAVPLQCRCPRCDCQWGSQHD